MGLNDINKLSHTSWNCKYHIVFAPKYGRLVFYKDKKVEVGKILRKLCEWKGVKIIEAEVCPDHIHMLMEIPPKMSISSFMGYQAKVVCSWQAVVMRLRITQGTGGYARIGKTTGLSGGCFFLQSYFQEELTKKQEIRKEILPC